MNGARKEQVKAITERVLKAFGMSYLRAYKIIAIRDAKAKRNQKKDDDSSQEEAKGAFHLATSIWTNSSSLY